MATKTFYMDTDNNLVFTNGNLTYIEDGVCVMQRVKNRLLFSKGEWFLDTDEGTPWFTSILKRNPNWSLITSLLKKRITNTDGVSTLDAFEFSDYDKTTRKLTITFSITTDYGETVSSGETNITV